MQSHSHLLCLLHKHLYHWRKAFAAENFVHASLPSPLGRSPSHSSDPAVHKAPLTFVVFDWNRQWFVTSRRRSLCSCQSLCRVQLSYEAGFTVGASHAASCRSTSRRCCRVTFGRSAQNQHWEAKLTQPVRNMSRALFSANAPCVAPCASQQTTTTTRRPLRRSNSSDASNA